MSRLKKFAEECQAQECQVAALESILAGPSGWKLWTEGGVWLEKSRRTAYQDGIQHRLEGFASLTFLGKEEGALVGKDVDTPNKNSHMNEFVSLDDYSTSIGCPVSIHSVLLRSSDQQQNSQRNARFAVAYSLIKNVQAKKTLSCTFCWKYGYKKSSSQAPALPTMEVCTQYIVHIYAW